MRLLLYDMGAYTQNDIMETLDRMGISYQNVLYKLKDISQDAYFEKRIKELLASEQFDAVFSVNYYPVLADICYRKAIPYLSWSYDSPLSHEKIKKTLGYKTNYAFFFDKAECVKYWRKGYQNVYHLPLAVNTERLDKIELTEKEKQKYQAEISMVGQLYDAQLQVLMMPLDDYEKGYLTGIMEAQTGLYGCYFLPEVLTEEFLDRINDRYEALGQKDIKLSREGLILSVARHITHMERLLLLDILSEHDQVQLYGPDKPEKLSKVQWRGSAGYFDEMPRVFKQSKINLNVSLKCIESGIPLRALDIMGCGGFLLTNYQPELAESFVDGEELVMYTSLEEAVQKCAYYLEHEKERRLIAQNGYRKVCRQFGYENRLRRMLQTAGLPITAEPL